MTPRREIAAGPGKNSGGTCGRSSLFNRKWKRDGSMSLFNRKWKRDGSWQVIKE